jgi:hypothetical protein
MGSMAKTAWLLLPVLALGCGFRTSSNADGTGDDGGDGDSADLPADWEEAEEIPGLDQSECEGDPYGGTGEDGFDERATFTGEVGSVRVLYNDAHFRCEQPVEAFVRRGDNTLDVLVQPIDMNPDMVAGCDCLYDIVVEIKNLVAGDYAVSLSRRWDNINDPNDPVPIATDIVTVE